SEDGGSTFTTTVVDNSPQDLSSATGAITFTYSDALVSFSVVVGQSKPLFGNDGSHAVMDIGITGSFSKTGGGGTLVIDVTDTDFMPPDSPDGKGILTAKIGDSAPSGTTFTAYLNGKDPTSGTGGNNEWGGIGGTPDGSLLTVPAAPPHPPPHHPLPTPPPPHSPSPP